MAKQPKQPEQSEQPKQIIPINGIMVDDEGNSNYFLPGGREELTAEDIKKVVQGQKLDDETAVAHREPEKTLEEKQHDIRMYTTFLIEDIGRKSQADAQEIADLASETIALEKTEAVNDWSKKLVRTMYGNKSEDENEKNIQLILSIIDEADGGRFQSGGQIAEYALEGAREKGFADDEAETIARIASKAKYLASPTTMFFDEAQELALAKGKSQDVAQTMALIAAEARVLIDVADTARLLAQQMGETTDNAHAIAAIATRSKALTEDKIRPLWKKKDGRVKVGPDIFKKACALEQTRALAAHIGTVSEKSTDVLEIRVSDIARIATKAVLLVLEKEDVYRAGLALFRAKNESDEKALVLAQGEVNDFVTNAIGRSLEELRLKEKTGFAFATVEGVDSNNIAEAGWGIIFADSDKDKVASIMQALKPLLDYRKAQAGGTYEDGGLYREFIDDDAFFAHDDKRTFLDRQGIGFGPVDPRKGVPYYLLIVADPEAIPYEFQTELDVQFAVGRIWFVDAQGKLDLEAYKRYARSVVVAERDVPSTSPLPRTATFFGVRTKGDVATELSAEHLIKPLADIMTEGQPKWKIQTMVEQDATKANLKQILGGDKTPAFVFTASHGMCFPNGNSKQIPHQGALLCQDWPGPRNRISPDHYFAAEDIDDNAKLLGTIAFFFACFGAGTPKLDNFAEQAFKARPDAIAPKSFLSSLPMRMLSHPKGGALAVVGHVERAWGYSFLLGDKQEQLQTFQSTLKALFDGKRLGYAFEYFNVRHAEVSVSLAGMMQRIETQSKTVVAELWTTNNDARNYVILGDPAVKLPVDA